MAKPNRRQGCVSPRDRYLCAAPLRPFRGREGDGMPKRLSELVEGLKGERLGFREMEIRGVTCDSRQVAPGYLFVAVTGTKLDGLEYLPAAIRGGAVAAVAERAPAAPVEVPVLVVRDARAALAELAARYHDHPTMKLNVVGVTGTKGKTTTTWLLRSVFAAAREKVGLLGTIEYALGHRVMASPMTTPSADELQKAFAEMVSAGCRSAAMEVSSHALALERTRGIRFAAGVFTNLTRDHLDFHKTPARYRAAKGRLFEQLTPRSIAVVNADDPASGYMGERAKGRVITYGLDRRAEVGAWIESCGFGGMRLRLRLGTEEVPVASRLVGRHNASNLLAAAATAWGMGYDLDAIKSGLEAMTAVPGRLEPVDEGQDFSVLVDYAHTEDSLRNVLGCLRPLAQKSGGRLILVFGCGGDRDTGKRPLMGRAAEDLADFFIITSDNPRSEDPLAIIKDIEEGLSNHSKYLIEPDRYAAIKIAIGMARKDDVVLIAGKGHETYQVCGEATRPFDDREVARRILKERMDPSETNP